MLADLHIHSCLSPCGDLDMSPRKIAKKAKESGLEAIALTDHNSALNCPPLANICQEIGIKFIPGIEVNSKEGVHLITLFKNVETTLEFGEIIYNKLPDIKNLPDKFGDQVQVNEAEEIINIVDKLLTAAVNLSISELVKLVHEREGLIIPAHINRPAYGIIETLGFLPSDDFDNIEVSRHFKEKDKINPLYIDALERFPNYYSASDAHFLEDIGKGACEIDSLEF